MDDGGGGLLDREEVEFLLDAGEQPRRGAPSEPSRTEPGTAEVTMRGDLDKINLTDIFQTLAMSKMEGMLGVSTPLERREVFFRDGFVRCLMPARTETLRLGQRLVRAGHATTEQLRSALLEQKRSRASLGDVLVERGLISRDDIEDIVANQLQEELFSLFTWRHGSFAFYKGPPTDPVTAQRIEDTPEFEANGVLLEVARRSDEWERVFHSLGSLDEMFVPVEATAPDALPSEDHQRVHELADGSRNVRDLADAALLELFECAIIIRELVDAGALRRAPLDDALNTVEEILAGGDARRAQLALDALLRRDEPLDIPTSRRAAELLGKCGERRRAAEYLCTVAERAPDRQTAVELTSQARDLDRRSVPVLRALLNAVRETGETESSARLLALRTELIDLLLEEGEYDEAVELLRALEADTEDLSATRPRLARALARLGRTDEGVDCLLGYADTLDEDRDKRRLAGIYEQVLRIDFRRKDVARKLKVLHASKLARRARRVAVVAVAVALLGAGAVQYRSSQRDERLGQIAAGLRQQVPDTARLQAGEDGDAPDYAGFEAALRQAREALREAVADAGAHPAFAEVERRLSAAGTALTEARGSQRDRESGKLHDEAVALLESGELSAALRTWDAVIALRGSREATDNAIRAAIYDALGTTRSRLGELRKALPGSPAPSARRPVLEAALARLEGELRPPHEKLARALKEQRDSSRIRDLFDRDRDVFEVRLRDVNGYLAELDQQRAEYRAALDQTRTAEELTPLYHRAQEFENAYRFAEALEAYRELAANHPEEDALKARFRARVQRYASILRYLDLLAQATDDGDFASATGQLSLLRRQYPEIPFDEFVRLPVRVETQPSGARVLVEDAPVGRAPLDTAYRPGVKTRIRIELEGYHSEETVLEGDRIGRVRSLLARRAAWSREAGSTIDQAPLVDRPRGQVVYTDRGGRVAAVAIADGTPRWTIDTGDVSGLLTAPTQLRSREGRRAAAVIGSVDGPLRALSLTDGGELWQLPTLPCEATPVCAKGVIAVATLHDELVGVSTDDGSRLWQVELPGPVEADLRLHDDRVVLAVARNGHVLAVDLLDGSLRWSAEVGLGAVARPALSGNRLVVVSDDGRVVALDARSGSIHWRRRDFAGLVVAPAIAAGRVFVAEARTLHALDLDAGRTVQSLDAELEFRGELSIVHGRLFASDSGGTVRVLDPRSLKPDYLLRAGGAARAPVVAVRGSGFLAAFDDRSLQYFGKPR